MKNFFPNKAQDQSGRIGTVLRSIKFILLAFEIRKMRPRKIKWPWRVQGWKQVVEGWKTIHIIFDSLQSLQSYTYDIIKTCAAGDVIISILQVRTLRPTGERAHTSSSGKLPMTKPRDCSAKLCSENSRYTKKTLPTSSHLWGAGCQSPPGPHAGHTKAVRKYYQTIEGLSPI